jgi:hypothetical protein
VSSTQPAARANAAWDGRLLRWSNAGLEATIFYLLLAAWARPRDSQAALLPLLACLALPAGFAIRILLDWATSAGPARLLATTLAAFAWTVSVVRFCAPAGYWQADVSAGVLLFGAAFGGREGVGLQPLAFWSSLLLWWRGYALPTWEPGVEEALDRFRLACLAAGAIVGLATAADSPDSHTTVQLEQVLAIAAFFATALVTTGLSRRREMGGGTLAVVASERDGATPTVERRLILAPLIVIGVALVALGVAAWGAGSLSPEALAPAVALVGLILGTLGAALAWSLQQLVGLWPNLPPPASPGQATEVSAGQPDRQPAIPSQMLAWLGTLLLLAGVAGAIGVATLMYLALRRALARDVDDEIRAVEGKDDSRPRSIAPRGPAIVVALLIRLFKSLFDRTAPRRAVGVAPDQDMPNPAIDSIRAVYRAYLNWTAEQGCARKPEETPDELSRRVMDLRPEAGSQAALLTRLYVAARYGSQPCRVSELRQAESALARLRGSLQD